MADDRGYITDRFVANVARRAWSRVIIWSDKEPAVAKSVVETLKEPKVSDIERPLPEGLCHMIRRVTARRNRR